MQPVRGAAAATGQDVSGRVRVAIRVRPMSADEIASGAGCVVGTSFNSIEITDPVSLEMSAAFGASLPTFRVPRRAFSFDRVYTTATQAALYADLGRSVLDHAFAGYNACVFAYGQTGRCAAADSPY